MEFETHTLKNGLKVLLAPVEDASSVTVMAMTGTGSRYESARENGMAHFLEHMVFKGTKNRPNAKIIAEEIDSVGGMFNAFTGKDHTAYYAKTDAHHFDTVFSVVSDIFLNAKFPAKEIERERGTIIEEINMYEDMPIIQVQNNLDAVLFGSRDPLGRSILGPKKNIRAFTRADFRQYFERNYRAENSAICIAGSFSKTKALKEARRVFADMRTGDTPEHQLYTHAQARARVHLTNKQTDQTHLAIGVPAVPIGHDDEATSEVLAAILGGGMSSRLFTQVRERRGLAYYVRAEYDAYDDIGLLFVRAGVGNKSAQEAIRVILDELSKVTRAHVSEKELIKAREHVKGTTALSLETTDAQAAFMGHTALVRKSSEGLEAFNKAIDAVTARDVRRVARELFETNKLNLALIGPHKNEKKFYSLLTLS